MSRKTYVINTGYLRRLILAGVEHEGTTEGDIMSTSRFKEHVMVRKAVIWVALKRYSHVSLGKFFKRHHTTIRHNRISAEDLIERDGDFRKLVLHLEQVP